MNYVSGVACILRADIIGLTRQTRAGAIAAACALPCLALAPVVTAQTTEAADSERISEITVTAARLEQRSQAVPISLTPIGSKELADFGIASSNELGQLAPSLYVQEGTSNGSPRFVIRGITANDDSPQGVAAVAIYIDDVYQASQFATSTQLFDLQRIEVLRGPQGTTFGKNTTAGAVAYFSQTPTNKLEGYVRLRGAEGNQPQRFVEGALNVPLGETLAVRFSGRADWQDDWVRDVNLDREYGHGDSQSGRAQLQWAPSSGTTVNLSVFGTRYRGPAPLYHGEIADQCNGLGGFAGLYLCPNGTPLPLQAPGSRDTIALSDLDLFENFDNSGATLRVQQRLASFDLTSITHYRDSDLHSTYDVDGAPGDLFAFYLLYKWKQYGQELRITSDPERRLSGLLGFYYQYDTARSGNAFASTAYGPPLDFNSRYNEDTKTKTLATFGGATFKLTDKLSLAGGLRWSREDRRRPSAQAYFFSGGFDWTQTNVLYGGAPPVAPDDVLSADQSVKANRWTWDTTLNYTHSRDLMLFARVADGFRSGGFNQSNVFLPPSLSPPYEPETVRSYEIGVKSEWLNGRLRVNGSVFQLDYKDQQVSRLDGGVILIDNAGGSKSRGVELEVTMNPVRALELRAGLGYNNAHYTEYDSGFGVSYAGNRLVFAPARTANASLSYSFPFNATYELVANTSWSYRSELFLSADNDPALRRPSLMLGNVRVAAQPAEGKGLSLAAFVNNVADKEYGSYQFAWEPGWYGRTYSPGILYGVEATYQW